MHAVYEKVSAEYLPIAKLTYSHQGPDTSRNVAPLVSLIRHHVAEEP